MQIEIPDELAAQVVAVARETGQDVASLTAEMLTEAIKMRRIPGIVFADGATGRRARIGGTGIEVFEVIDVYVAANRDSEELKAAFHWLDNFQLNAALAYYEAYPDEINPRLRTDESDRAAAEALWATNPRTRPAWRTEQVRTGEHSAPAPTKIG